MKNEFAYHGSLKNHYFEGWYFKNVTKKGEIMALIPGIAWNQEKKEVFLQIITNDQSFYLTYPFNECSFTNTEIKIGPNLFTKEGMVLNVEEPSLHGVLFYKDLCPLKTSWYAPTIMGPFSYLKMQCNHAIISMNHQVTGDLILNGQELSFSEGRGYLEKDFGSSFPKQYIWCQGNDAESSFFLSIAHIPFGLFSFQGMIGVLCFEGREYRFATYYGGSIKQKVKPEKTILTLSQGRKRLQISYVSKEGCHLVAPSLGGMTIPMKESLGVPIEVQFYHREKLLFAKTFLYSGLEEVKKTP